MTTEQFGRRARGTVRRFSVMVVSGPDTGRAYRCDLGSMTIGTAPEAGLSLSDPTVSRFHCELEASDDGVIVRDLSSRNGTLVGGVALGEAKALGSVELALGATRVQVELRDERFSVDRSSVESFGALVGGSIAMKQVFAVLERAAASDTTVTIVGESGTGKELAARAIHDHSARRAGPFEVVDCGGLPPTLAESELFGHERGAFTGASFERPGAFELADGGTIFLDELGELPLELQPKLLRVLAEGEVRRVGARRSKKVDVRVVAATNRDLRRAVNQGRFRADLYYRLAVVVVRMPSLRERMEDLPALVRTLIEKVRATRRITGDSDFDEEFWAAVRAHDWPGNVRELRNFVEQVLVLGDTIDPASFAGAETTEREPALDPKLWSMPLRAAKDQLVERFERDYLARMLAATGGNIAEAARRAGVHRGTVFRALRRNTADGD